MAVHAARSGAPEGVVVVADFQQAGRGRQGRTWEAAPRSSLLVSVLLRPALPPDRRHAPVAAVALAGCDACEEVAGFRPALKWPNDLVVGDAKLAGVLGEAEGGAVVVGLGMNLSAAASWPDGAVAAEDVAARPVDRDALLSALLSSLSRWTLDWTAVAPAYRRACATVGRAVRVDLADETFTGTAADVSDEGHLLVDVGACLRTVTAADVVHLRPFPGHPA